MLSIREANKALERIADKDKFEKMLHTAAIITDVLMQQNIKPVIVGGLSVEIYTPPRKNDRLTL